MILRLALVLAPKTGDITLMYAYPRCLIKYVVPTCHLFGFINLPAATFSTRRSTIAPKMPRYTYGLVAVCIAHLLSGCGGGGGGGLAVSDVFPPKPDKILQVAKTIVRLAWGYNF